MTNTTRTTAYGKIKEGLEEAAAVAKGKSTGAVMHTPTTAPFLEDASRADLEKALIDQGCVPPVVITRPLARRQGA